MILLLPKFFGLNGVWFVQPTVITAIVIVKELRSYEKIEETLEEAKAI